MHSPRAGDGAKNSQGCGARGRAKKDTKVGGVRTGRSLFWRRLFQISVTYYKKELPKNIEHTFLQGIPKTGVNYREANKKTKENQTKNGRKREKEASRKKRYTRVRDNI